MKFFWPILLICIVLGNSLQDKETLKKVGKVYMFLKTLYELRDKNLNRKLQENTDTTDGEVGVDEDPKPIEAAAATEDLPKNTGNSSAPYQIKKFYGFTQNKADSFFNFHMLFSFLGELIAKVIKMRLRILYAPSRLRNLEDAAQSVPCKCDISEGFESGVEGNGENIDYSCEGKKDAGREVANVNLDTKVPMDMDGVTVPFDDVNFSEEAAEQAKNITAADTFTDGWIVVNSFDEKFLIKGKPQPAPFLTSWVGKTINITFVTTGSGRRLEDSHETYECKVESDKTEETQIQCDGEIKTTKDKLKYARSDDVNLALLPGQDLQSAISAKSGSGSGPVYKKSSSGLSGGAIAGIVIACVAVLIAAAVAAIMLRKPSPPVDNTTVVDLKQENI